MDDAYSTHGEERNSCRVLVGKPDGPGRNINEDNIKMDLVVIEWAGKEGTYLAQDGVQ
jgi:hypothetical protein